MSDEKATVIYPKLVKHSNGYLVWARPIGAKNIWRTRGLVDGDNGWYVNISRNGEQFGTYGPFASKQIAMEHGMAQAGELPEEDPLP